MSRRLASLCSLLLFVVALSGCSGGLGGAGCTSSQVQSYPPPVMFHPTADQDGVSLELRSIVFTTHTAKLVGTVNLNTPNGSLNLVPTIITQTGSLYTWAAPLPVNLLQPQTRYTLRYFLQYPGACGGPTVTTNNLIGSFTTGSS
jgi:hypothetical protein